MLGVAMLVGMLLERGACLGQQGSCSALSEPVAGSGQQGKGNRGALQFCAADGGHRPHRLGAQRTSWRLHAAGHPATQAGPAAPADSPDIMLACPAVQISSLLEHIRCHVVPHRGVPIPASYASSALPLTALTEWPLACPISIEGYCGQHAGHNHRPHADCRSCKPARPLS